MTADDGGVHPELRILDVDTIWSVRQAHTTRAAAENGSPDLGTSVVRRRRPANTRSATTALDQLRDGALRHV